MTRLADTRAAAYAAIAAGTMPAARYLRHRPGQLTPVTTPAAWIDAVAIERVPAMTRLELRTEVVIVVDGTDAKQADALDAYTDEAVYNLNAAGFLVTAEPTILELPGYDPARHLAMRLAARNISTPRQPEPPPAEPEE